RQYGLHTDSSYRFERGVDYQLPEQAMTLATHLILSICGGKVGEIIRQTTPALPNQFISINLRAKQITKVLGIELAPNLVEQILTRLGCVCIANADKQQWQVTVPSYRYDLKIEVDLIEELARIYGYENIPAGASLTSQIMDKIDTGLTLNRIKQHLAGI